MPNTTQYPDTALGRLMAAARLRWCEVAARAGVSEKALRALATQAGTGGGIRLDTLARIAAALGAAPAELLPTLAVRPRSGLLWERGVFTASRKPRVR